MSKEAMKLALEALEHCKDVIVERGLNGSPEFAKKWGLTLPLERSEKAITALREALAEDVPEVGFGNTALDKMAENARELGLDYEMPITMQEGEFDCTHAERLCAELKAAHPVTPCTHPSLGACSLREDGTASRWNCVMCGTEFVPKAKNRWAEFNETTKRNIKHAEWYMSTHANLVQQTPTAWILKCGEQQELWWEKPPFGETVPLYTSPQPAQPSKPLTKDQIAKFYGGDSPIVLQIIRDTEAAHGIKENT